MIDSRRSLDVPSSPDSRRAFRARAAAAVTVLAALIANAPSARANHKDERLGYTIQTPNKWTEVPLSPDERWMVGKYLSDKTNFWTEKSDGWSREHRPDMEMIAFVDAAVKEKAKLVQKEKRDGHTEWIIGFESPFKGYKDFMGRRYQGGGWFVTEEKEDKVGDVPVTCYDIKVDKSSWEGPKHIVTWVYHVPDVDIAIQFEAIEDAWPKLQADFIRCLRSFKSIQRSGEALYEPSTTGDKVSWTDESKLAPDARKSRRAAIEKAAHEKAIAKLPDGWTSKRDGRKLRATRLLKTAIDKGSKNPLVYQALGEVYADDDKTSEALAAWKKALEIDPFDEKVYARMAFQLKESDKQESTRLRALALELGADDPWANLASDDEGGEATTEPGKKKPGEPPR